LLVKLLEEELRQDREQRAEGLRKMQALEKTLANQVAALVLQVANSAGVQHLRSVLGHGVHG